VCCIKSKQQKGVKAKRGIESEKGAIPFEAIKLK
jgi:hypothetical protein